MAWQSVNEAQEIRDDDEGCVNVNHVNMPQVDILGRRARAKGRLDDADTSLRGFDRPVALLGDLHRPLRQVPPFCG